MLYSLTMFSKLCLLSEKAMRKQLSSMSPGGLILVLSLLLSANSIAIAKPVIFNCSCIAGPGDIVNLQGYDLDEATTVMCATNDGVAESLKIVNRGNNVLHVQLPAKSGLYAITVQRGSESSNTVFPNRAKPMHFDTTSVAPNGLFRVYGRNLCAPHCEPQVSLLGDDKIFKATV